MITSGRKSFKNPFRYSLKRALSFVRVSGRVVRGLYGRERKGSSGESKRAGKDVDIPVQRAQAAGHFIGSHAYASFLRRKNICNDENPALAHGR